VKASSLLAPALLVVVGIAVYDSLRSSGGGTPLPGGAEVVRDVPTPAPAAVEPARPTVPQERLAEIEARLDRLESTVRGWLRPPGDPSGRDSPPRSVPFVTPLSAPGDVEIRPEEVARFRALEEAADSQRRAESLHRSLSGALDKLNLHLYPDERARVLEEALRAAHLAQEAQKRLAAASAPAAERLRAFDEIRTQFQATVERLVPGVRADAVTATLAPLVGLRPGSRSTDDEEEEEGDRSLGR
jgi:hypothetical protein